MKISLILGSNFISDFVIKPVIFKESLSANQDLTSDHKE